MNKFFFRSFLLAGIFAASSLNYSCSDSDEDTKVEEVEEVTVDLKLRVVAAVIDANGNVLNVQEANANTTKDYVMSGNSFKHRVLIEDFTGAWCGWCPRVSHSIEQLETSNNDDIVAVALHNGDKFAFAPQSGLANSLWSKFGVPTDERGYPFAVLNRSEEWAATSGNAMNKNQATALIKPSSPIGIKISSNLDATAGKVNVSFKFNETYSDLKYIIYVIQDGVVLTQTNYTGNYGGASKLKDFVHNSIVKATNNVSGTSITTSTADSEFTTGEINLTYKNF